MKTHHVLFCCIVLVCISCDRDSTPRKSDENCPPATTISSAAPPSPMSFGILHGRRSGGSGSQVNQLVKTFNNALRARGDEYCGRQGCYAEIVEAKDADIETGESDNFIGWTELTIIPTGGNPTTVTGNLKVYFSHINVKTENVFCYPYEFVEGSYQRIGPVIPPPPSTPDPEPPAAPCEGPEKEVVMEAGTILASYIWRDVSPLTSPENYPRFEIKLDSVRKAANKGLDDLLATVQCPEGCEEYWDPEPQFDNGGGDVERPPDSWAYRSKLINTIRARCRRKE